MCRVWGELTVIRMVYGLKAAYLIYHSGLLMHSKPICAKVLPSLATHVVLHIVQLPDFYVLTRSGME